MEREGRRGRGRTGERKRGRRGEGERERERVSLIIIYFLTQGICLIFQD